MKIYDEELVYKKEMEKEHLRRRLTSVCFMARVIVLLVDGDSIANRLREIWWA